MNMNEPPSIIRIDDAVMWHGQILQGGSMPPADPDKREIRRLANNGIFWLHGLGGPKARRALNGW